MYRFCLVFSFEDVWLVFYVKNKSNSTIVKPQTGPCNLCTQFTEELSLCIIETGMKNTTCIYSFCF